MSILAKKALEPFINKLIYLRTSTGLFIKIEEISESNSSPTFVLVSNKNHATEFILSQKTDTNVSIRINADMKNQNGTFGYHLYVLPDNDIVYGSGNDEIFAQFMIELAELSGHSEQYIKIKSAYKPCYLCHEYNVLRCREHVEENATKFIIENVNIPCVQRTVCIISYGFMKNIIDLKNSPIINSLKEIYPSSTLDIYIFSPNILDEFYNVTFDAALINADKCNVTVKTYPYDITHYMKLSHFFNMPIISNKNKVYSYRTLSMFWNLSEAIKMMVATKKIYNTYILLRNDSYSRVNIYKKLIDPTRMYCYNGDSIDTHFMVGKEILSLAHLYDYYVKHRTMYNDATPQQIIAHFFATQNLKTGFISNIAPPLQYQVNQNKTSDIFYKTIYEKYKELVGH
jgi:hypothetical protein